MGKVRKKSRNTFNYSVNRKKLKRRAQKKAAPRITCDEIRNAWNDSKSVAGNMADMGLAADPNKALPIHTNTVKNRSAEQKQVRKPYVIEKLKALASLPSKKTMGISSDMVLYVRHMVENYGEDYKAMARDDENYYQDTPKQIQRKINLYKRHHPDEYQALITSTTKQ
ncbi:nucleolar protein 16 [Pseudophryne corroboree]|uniref:nucleolar protein 16 n=1 Tax=Pseudophryne corroboree TaxID=495146 RepID=UPI0030817B6B